MDQLNNNHNIGTTDQNMLFEAMETNNMMNNMPSVNHVPFVLSAPGQSNLAVDSRSSFGGGIITPFMYEHGNVMNNFNTPISSSSRQHSYDRMSESGNGVTTPKKKTKKKKVSLACVYCRRSHMTCDSERPCLRCVKRGIGHMCHDEPITDKSVTVKTENESMENTTINPSDSLNSTSMSDTSTSVIENPIVIQDNIDIISEANNPTSANNATSKNNGLDYGQGPLFHSEYIGSEFSSLNEFLSLMDETSPYDLPGIQTDLIELVSTTANDNFAPGLMHNPAPSFLGLNKTGRNADTGSGSSTPGSDSNGNIDEARDKFFLTAADPPVPTHSAEDRLTQVINAKLDAGLLKPFNHASGYARLQKYMDNYMNQSSRQRILKPISTFRPAFRAVASSLKDVNLVLVEEAFERMLLDYDRVFTSMAIPACLWRRTGEIYRGNKEFAGLVNVSVEDLRNGKLAIYELMSEESAVNYWEKYGQIAFDVSQKGVLTSCNLRTKDGRRRNACCFSFTIQRDRYNIPSCIVGHFIPVNR